MLLFLFCIALQGFYRVAQWAAYDHCSSWYKFINKSPRLSQNTIAVILHFYFVCLALILTGEVVCHHSINCNLHFEVFWDYFMGVGVPTKNIISWSSGNYWSFIQYQLRNLGKFHWHSSYFESSVLTIFFSSAAFKFSVLADSQPMSSLSFIYKMNAKIT